MTEVPESIRLQTAAALNGDIAALGVVFQFYRPQLYAHALRLCGNTPVAQDALQDAFIAALTHLHSLRNADLFYPWLKKILIHRCYRLLKLEKSSVDLEKPEVNDNIISLNIENKLEHIANAQLIHEALSFLSDELKSCVLLRYFSDFNSYEYISKILAVPIGTVRSRLSAAKEQLTARLKILQDAGDTAIRDSRQWTEFYRNGWSKLYDDLQVRNEQMAHIDKQLRMRLTSGNVITGRENLEMEINNDLIFGSRMNVEDVVSSGNITIIEASNTNHPDHPDRCAPSSVFVLFRVKDKVETIHLFDAPRG